MAKCKYPNEACANMKFFHGNTYCDSVPCTLKEELPNQRNADKIRSMSDEELAEFMLDFANDEINTVSNCGSKEYLINWLQSEAE